jgi:hypothetical protein
MLTIVSSRFSGACLLFMIFALAVGGEGRGHWQSLMSCFSAIADGLRPQS